jgi:hypothetical protein
MHGTEGSRSGLVAMFTHALIRFSRSSKSFFICSNDMNCPYGDLFNCQSGNTLQRTVPRKKTISEVHLPNVRKVSGLNAAFFSSRWFNLVGDMFVEDRRRALWRSSHQEIAS